MITQIIDMNPSDVYKKIVKDALKINAMDLHRNQHSKVILKRVFGALRPWWSSAYDTDLDGNDFNVPEVQYEPNQYSLQQFNEDDNQMLSDFCEVIADALGYVNENEYQEQIEEEELLKDEEEEEELHGVNEFYIQNHDNPKEKYYRVDIEGRYIGSTKDYEKATDMFHKGLMGISK